MRARLVSKTRHSVPASEPAPDRWRPALTELALVLTGLVTGIAVLFVLRALGVWPNSSRGLGLASGPMITGIAATFYWFASTRMDPVVPVFAQPLPRAPVLRTIAVTLIAIALALVGSAAIGWLVDLLGAPVSEQASILEIVAGWHDGTDRVTMMVLGVCAVVLAPFAEECLFRGLLFARLRRSSGRPVAYVVTAIGFAAIHGNVAGLVVYVWLGLVFAWSMERTGRVGAAIAVHMGNNAFAFGLLLVAPPV